MMRKVGEGDPAELADDGAACERPNQQAQLVETQRATGEVGGPDQSEASSCALFADVELCVEMLVERDAVAPQPLDQRDCMLTISGMGRSRDEHELSVLATGALDEAT
jgi:hypothetical protein